MKNIYFILFYFISLTYLNAQVEINPGLKGGLNLANLSNVEGSKNLTSFHIGGTVSFKFAKFYTLQPEILYSKQGSDYNNADAKQYRPELNYLSIPVNNLFYVGNQGLNFQVAPVIDILLSHKNVTSPQGVDIAVAFGIGYDLPSGIRFSIAYKQGLADLLGRNVNTGNGYETTDISELILNSVVQFSAAYKFDL